MKTNKSLLKTQRRNLDEKLRTFVSARQISPPKAGWVKAVREALGLTSAQLAQRMGIQQSGVTLLEQREVLKTVSLETLQRAARAMKCELVYAIVPQESLEKIVDQQALEAAREILQRTLHTMALEQQQATAPINDLHLSELAMELKNKMDRKLWSFE